MWGGGGAKLKEIQFRQGSSDVQARSVVRSSDVWAVSDIRCLGKIRARDELHVFVMVMMKMVKSGGFCGWEGWGKGEKLDTLKTKQIHGSKPTKYQHTTKSQKKLGLFSWGIFKLG